MLNDRSLLLAIQAILNTGDWSPNTVQDIAELMNENGFPITDEDDNEEDLP